jgi:cold shock CspA family protein
VHAAALLIVLTGELTVTSASLRCFGHSSERSNRRGGKDVFVHISAVERAGLSSLNEGQVIEYEEVVNRGKTSAENLKVQR